MATSAGDLDRRIKIVRQGETGRNEYNEPIYGDVTVASLWAKRSDASDSTKLEYEAAGQVSAAQISRFVVRSSPRTRGIEATDRIQHDGSDWNILGVKETGEGRKRFLEITAAREAD